MRIVYFFLLIFFLNACSFDNRSGIWENENNRNQKKSYLKDFETITSSKSKFNKIISKDASFTFKLPKQIINNGWEDIFYNETNNFVNFKYDNQNQYKRLLLEVHLKDVMVLPSQPIRPIYQNCPF